MKNNYKLKFFFVLSLTLLIKYAAIAQYCAATNQATSCITNVALNTLNRSSAACENGPNFYTLVPSATATTTVMQGITYPFSVTIDNSNTAIISVWIDYNQDFVLDATEWTQVATNAAVSSTSTVNITIPITATPGQTRMRVRSRNSGNPNGSGDACLAMGSGETEDYTITIAAAVDCAGTPGPSNTTSSASSVCVGTNANLGLSASYAFGGMSFQWQSSTDGTNYSNIPSANAANYSAAQTVATYYQCVITCGISGLSVFSTPIQVGMNPITNCYCTSNATSTGDEEILNVTIGSINNTSTCATTGGAGSILNQYSDFSTTVGAASLTQTITYPFSVQVGTCGGNFTNSTRIFIDFNQNGLFTDPGEDAYTAPTSVVGPHFEIGTITVPVAAIPGTTKMRVITVETGTPTSITPCGTYIWGETEDYAINIIAAAPCAGTPDPSNTLSSQTSVCVGTGFNLSLDASYSFTGFSYQWQASVDGTNFNDIFNAANSTLSTTQTEANYYQCVVTCNNSGLSITSTPILVGMNPLYNCYCTSNATSTGDEEILNVSIGSLNNSSTCAITGGPGSILNQYSDFTSTVAAPNLALTLTYSLSVQVGTCGGSFTNSTRVFIDYNQNGLFTDAGETVYTSANGTVGPHLEIGNINIPATATSGLTRMRVITVETGTPTSINPCGTYIWGETEDYLLNILPLPSNPPTPIQDSNTPTCVTGTDLSVPGTPNTDEAWYWQTTADGTDLSNPVLGVFTVYHNGTYYVRTNNTVYGIWSLNSDSVVVSNIPVAPTPPAPTAAANPACHGTEITVPAPADPNTTYYWQGTTLNGYSNLLDASSSYSITSTGTYYVSAYDASTSCWSYTSSIDMVIGNFTPEIPTSSGDIIVCSGVTSAVVEAVVPQSGAILSSFGTNLQSFGPDNNISITIPPLPNGATVISSQLQIIGAAAVGFSWEDDIQISLSGIVNLPSTQIAPGVFNAGSVTPNPFNIPISSIPTTGGNVVLTLSESFDDGGPTVVDATFTLVRIITIYSLPSTDVFWYDTQTGGNLQGPAGFDLEAVGTGVLPTTAQPGIYTLYAEASSDGCTSTDRVAVNITVNPSPHPILGDTSACSTNQMTLNAGNNGCSFFWSTGETDQIIYVTADGMYTVDMMNSFGCLTTDTVNVGFHENVVASQSVNMCYGHPLVIGLNVHTQPGTYIDHIYTFLGCDSALTTHLTFSPPITHNQSFTICGGSHITVGSHTYNTTGIYNDTLPSFNGCDSLLTTALTVNNAVGFMQSFTLCSGDSVHVGSHYYNSTGVYSDTLQAINSCDSIITTNLVINSASVGSQSHTLCAGEVFVVGSSVYNSSGVYHDVLTSFNGCDSTVTTTITMLATSSHNQQFTRCSGQSITVGVHTYSVTGTYTDVLQSINGCDSTVTTSLIILSPVTISQTHTLCQGDVYTVGIHNYTVTGDYTDTYSTAAGCDSVIISHLTFYPLPSVNFSLGTSTVCLQNVPLSLSGGSPIGGVFTGQGVSNGTFAPSNAGVGVHTIVYTASNSFGCINSSSQNIGVQNCIGIAENTLLLTGVSIYPNPTTGLFNIEVSNADFKQLFISISDIQGREVYSELDKNINVDFKKQINIENLNKGIYFIKLNTNNEVAIHKLVIQ